MINPIECSPRKIKRIVAIDSREEIENKTTEIYEFYRLLIYPSVIRLKDEKDKINCSLWLNRIDVEEMDLKIHLIKILFISLQNYRNFSLFLFPPPEDLSELNVFDEDNTMDMVKVIQANTNTFYANEEFLQEAEYKRSAVVATDMCSYSSAKTSKYMVQSFYVRSNFPIQTWYNPTDIILPPNFDHNEWELYLNRFEIRTKSKDNDDNKPENTCESIIKAEQVSKEMDTACIFRWHPHSILYNKDRPRRLAAFVEVDSEVQNQPSSQQQLDESAFNIVHKKSFPGYKILNPRIYSTVLMPDPTFVFNTTGVKIIYNQTAAHRSESINDGERRESRVGDTNDDDENFGRSNERCSTTTRRRASCDGEKRRAARDDDDDDDDAAVYAEQRRSCCCGDSRAVAAAGEPSKNDNGGARERRIDGDVCARSNPSRRQRSPGENRSTSKSACRCYYECRGDRCDDDGPNKTEEDSCDFPVRTALTPTGSSNTGGDCCCRSPVDRDGGHHCRSRDSADDICRSPMAAADARVGDSDHGNNDDDGDIVVGSDARNDGIPPCPYNEKSSSRRHRRRTYARTADESCDADSSSDHYDSSPPVQHSFVDGRVDDDDDASCFESRRRCRCGGGGRHVENVTSRTSVDLQNSDNYCDGLTTDDSISRHNHGKSVDFSDDVAEILTAESSSSCG